MNKIVQRLFAVGCAAVLLTACSAESVDEQMATLNASGTTLNVQTADIQAGDLVGIWKMHTMTSSDSVDFDKNGSYTLDLLEETDCFDPMFFDFQFDGTVDTRQARLFFNSSTGQFTCQTTGDYKATYEVTGDKLSITFTIDGTIYTETKTVVLSTEGENEFLDVVLTKTETDAAVFISPDPGNTVASEIQKIDMRYIKE